MHVKLKFSVIVAGILLSLSLASLAAQTGDARGRDIHFRGPVKEISRDSNQIPTQLTIRVNQAQVQLILTPWTQVFHDLGFAGTLSQLRLDDFVEVNGFFTAGGRIQARQIHIEGRDAVETVGSLESIQGDWLRVDGIDFLLDAGSRIRRAGQTAPGIRSEIVPGIQIRLLAEYTGGLLRVEELEYGPRTVEDDPLRFEGVITQLANGLLSIDVGVDSSDALAAIDSNTSISGDLVPGRLVEVEGRFIPGTALVGASRLAVDGNGNGNVYDDDETEGEGDLVDLKGTILQVTKRPDGSVASIRVDSTLVILDAQTQIEYTGGSEAPDSALQVGKTVEVTGTLQPDSSLLANRIEVEKQEEEDEEEELELEGEIQGLTRLPDNSVSQITVSGKSVRVDPTTEIKKEGQPVSSSQLEKGQEVHVKAYRQPDNSFLAREIEIQ